MVPIVAIDAASSRVDVCCWDGEALRIEQTKIGGQASEGEAAERMRTLVQEFVGGRSFDVVLRTCDGCEPSEQTQSLVATIKQLGARRVRVVSPDDFVDPGAAAARQAADRMRWGTICALEIGPGRDSVSIVDPRGRLRFIRRSGGTKPRPRPDSESLSTPVTSERLARLAETIREAREFVDDTVPASHAPSIASSGWSIPPLVCMGADGPTVATALADAVGCRRLLIPTRAGVLPCLGLLLADIVLRIDRRLAPTPLDLPLLRREFAELMDEAYGKICDQGYDLDDAVCDRFVTLAPAEPPESTDETTLEADALADLGPLIDRFRRSRSQDAAAGHSVRDIAIRGMSIRAAISTPKPAFPAPASPLVECIVPSGSSPAEATAGADLPGPVAVNGAFERTIILPGWIARVQASGDVLVEKKEPGLRRLARSESRPHRGRDG